MLFQPADGGHGGGGALPHRGGNLPEHRVLNFARGDGSVERLIDVGQSNDERIEAVPHPWDNQYGWKIYVPVN